MGHVVAMPDTGATLATMIGLGVGIDYALFLITRHQEQLDAGMPVEESIARAVATSGSAIVFAGGTVVVALLSLRVAGIPLLSTLGLASAVAVVTAVLGGDHVPARTARAARAPDQLAARCPRSCARRRPAAASGGRGPGFVARRPVWVAVGLAALPRAADRAGALASSSARRTSARHRQSTTERKAYDLITAGFGVGYNGPLQVASKLDPVATPSDEYTKKYNKATSLQKQLEQAQKQLPKEQKQLEEAAEAAREASRGSSEAPAGGPRGAAQRSWRTSRLDLERSNSELLAQPPAAGDRSCRLTSRATSCRPRRPSSSASRRSSSASRPAGGRARRSAASSAKRLAAKARPLVRQLARIRAHERGPRAPDRQRAGRLRPCRRACRPGSTRSRADRAAGTRRARPAARRRPGGSPSRRSSGSPSSAGSSSTPRRTQLQSQAAALQRRADDLNARKAALTRQGDELQRRAPT